ncbi:MAG: EutN/CcmL family microcompartment protein [Planctomycetaceae bacterium]|nr:EutN/CcmL family microcompartment protein [Planctomycetaceae bacterium]MCA9098274.1 EutN/CcmL family microcompartment protein [Planctomycetaceae bacterium]
MNLATVIGRATSTVKHPSLNGWRLLVVQPLMADGGDDGPPLLAIDSMGARLGSQVIITSDGKAVSEAMGTKTTPVRWMVLGEPDE